MSLISSIRSECVPATPHLLKLTKYDQIVSVNENQSNYKNILPSNIFPLTVVATCHHCKIIYLHNFGLIFTADLIKIDKVHFFSHFYIMATKNLNCCLFIKNVFCCWPVSTLHVNRDFPLELFVVHWTTDVLHWLISHISYLVEF